MRDTQLRAWLPVLPTKSTTRSLAIYSSTVIDVDGVRVLKLDDWHDADPALVLREAGLANSELTLTIGVATRPPPERLRPLWEELTVSVAGPGVRLPDRCFVGVPDPGEASRQITELVRLRPQACLALGQLLRQTPHARTLPGLAAEAAVYSMLLGGSEFADWLATRGRLRPPPPPDQPLVRLERDGGRLSLTLNHPERRNAFSFRMREALCDALDVAIWDTAIEQVELTGSGQVFCSGGDLAEFGTATDLVAAYLVRLDRAPWRLIDRIADRITVRVRGAAVGAGIEMAAFAARIIATPETFFLLPEAEMGLVPGAGGTVSVPRRIGRWRTAWMVLTGARVDAVTARDWGLIDEIDPS